MEHVEVEALGGVGKSPDALAQALDDEIAVARASGFLLRRGALREVIEAQMERILELRRYRTWSQIGRILKAQGYPCSGRYVQKIVEEVGGAARRARSRPRARGLGAAPVPLAVPAKALEPEEHHKESREAAPRSPAAITMAIPHAGHRRSEL